MNMKIIKKNQFAILVIALMLVTAGYLNYTANEEDKTTLSSSPVSEDKVASIGDATLVSSPDLVENESVEEDVLEEASAISNEVNENNTIETSAKVKEARRLIK